MGRDMREVRSAITDTRFACGAAGNMSTGNKGSGTSLGEAEEEKGASAYDMKDMDPHSDTHPDQVIDGDHVLRSGHEPPDG